MAPTETHPETEQHEHTHEPVVLGPCEREVKVEVPQDIVTKETATIVAKYQKLARIPGFRKGKVPEGLIRRQFANEIKQEVVEQLIPRYLQKQTEQENLRPISQPRITDLHAHEGEPLRFSAVFEVFPDVKISDYKSHGVAKPQTEISDEEFDQEIDRVREQQASYENVDEERALQDGDYAQISFEGTPKGEEPTAEGKNPASMEDVLVEIGGANTVKEFNENLRGAKPGDDRTFDVVYPQDFGEQRLAGKTLTYKVHVNGIKKKTLPELNDDFAKELGQFESFDDLKTKLRENMTHQKQSTADAEAKDKVLDYLIGKSDFQVPEVLIDQQIDIRLDRGLRALAQQGMRAEDLRKLDMTRLRSAQRDQAIREVKSAMVLDKIADTENVQVSDEELEHEIRALSEHSGEDYTALRARLQRDGALDRIRERMRNEKTLNQLLS